MRQRSTAALFLLAVLVAVTAAEDPTEVHSGLKKGISWDNPGNGIMKKDKKKKNRDKKKKNKRNNKNNNVGPTLSAEELINLGAAPPTTSSSYTQIYGENCGKTREDFGGYMSIDRVINGNPTSIFNYPWQVVFVFNTLSMLGKIRPFCGGTIISHDWIFTAAHCVRSLHHSMMKVYANTTHINPIALQWDTPGFLDPDVGAWRMEIDHWVIHPDYKYLGPNKNDVALVKVTTESRMNFGHGVFPACLPSNNFCLSDMTEIDVTGFGTVEGQEIGVEWSTELRFASVPVLSKQTCEQQEMTQRYSVFITYQNEFCAGNGVSDACTGDSGGPIVYKDPATKVTTLVGAVSWGYGCNQRGFPGIYAKASQFVHWIAQTSGVYVNGMDYSFPSDCAMNYTRLDNYLNPNYSGPPAAGAPLEAVVPAEPVVPAAPPSPVVPPAPETNYVEPAAVQYDRSPFPLGRIKIGQRCLETISKRVKANFYGYVSRKNEKKCYYSNISKAIPSIEYDEWGRLVVLKRVCKRNVCNEYDFCLTVHPDRGNEHLQAMEAGKNKEKEADLLRWQRCEKDNAVFMNQQWVVENDSRIMRPLVDLDACFTFYNERQQRGYAKLTLIPEKCLPTGPWREQTDHALTTEEDDEWDPEG